jgi:hypothetical protein
VAFNSAIGRHVNQRVGTVGQDATEFSRELSRLNVTNFAPKFMSASGEERKPRDAIVTAHPVLSRLSAIARLGLFRRV